MKRLLLFVILLLVFVSCKEIIAEDITNEIPELILPGINDTVQVNPVHFKWKEIDGATNYHLTVVSTSFSEINSYVLDTVITGANFYYSLDSNEYELMLTAYNAGYVSDTLGPIKFWVGVEPTSSLEYVSLDSPNDDFFTNTSAFNNQFSWVSLANVTSYQFELREGLDFSTGTILEIQNNISTSLYNSSYSYVEGEYVWGIKGYYSDGTSTNYSIRSLMIDNTPPNIAVLSSPMNQSVLGAGIIPFTWSNGTDLGGVQSPINSLIEVSSDSGFGVIEYSNVVQGESESIELSAGNYFWRVINSDEAGNQVGSSQVNQITIF